MHKGCGCWLLSRHLPFLGHWLVVSLWSVSSWSHHHFLPLYPCVIPIRTYNPFYKQWLIGMGVCAGCLLLSWRWWQGHSTRSTLRANAHSSGCQVLGSLPLPCTHQPSSLQAVACSGGVWYHRHHCLPGPLTLVLVIILSHIGAVGIGVIVSSPSSLFHIVLAFCWGCQQWHGRFTRRCPCVCCVLGLYWFGICHYQ